jgi:predicted lipoprotein
MTLLRLTLMLLGLGPALLACTDSTRELPVPDPAVLSAASGSSEQSGTSQASPLEQQLLVAVANEIILPNYERLEQVATQFASQEGALAQYCSQGPDALVGNDQFLANFQELVVAVQATEMHAFGPAMANGAQLRNKLSSYHVGPISACGIDEIAILNRTEGFELGQRPSNQRGLGALDYLLFNPELKHSCPPQASITAQWNERSPEDQFGARCNAAKALADDLASAAMGLVSAWHPDEDDFASEFSEEATVGQNLQLLTDAMFFLEEGAKDAKLGNPLGIVAACSSTTCPNMIEFPHSKLSLAAISANLDSFQRLFEVNNQTGFDVVISDRGFDDVSQRFIDNTNEVTAYLGTVETDLSFQVGLVEAGGSSDCINAAANPSVPSESLPTCTLYGLIKRVVDDMKIDFVTILNVNLPGGTRADND